MAPSDVNPAPAAVRPPPARAINHRAVGILFTTTTDTNVITAPAAAAIPPPDLTNHWAAGILFTTTDTDTSGAVDRIYNVEPIPLIAAFSDKEIHKQVYPDIPDMNIPMGGEPAIKSRFRPPFRPQPESPPLPVLPSPAFLKSLGKNWPDEDVPEKPSDSKRPKRREDDQDDPIA